MPVTFVDGHTVAFTIGAIFDGDQFLGSYVMTRKGWEPHAVQDVDQLALARLADGVSEQDGARAVTAVAERFGAPDVETRAEYIEAVASRIDSALGLVYVMLALAVLIALTGIATRCRSPSTNGRGRSDRSERSVDPRAAAIDGALGMPARRGADCWRDRGRPRRTAPCQACSTPRRAPGHRERMTSRSVVGSERSALLLLELDRGRDVLLANM